MQYMGGKTRILKYILPIMNKYRGNRVWIEPFVGGGSVISSVTGKRIGYDINKYTIQALKTIRDNIDLIPKNNLEFTEKDYNELRNNDDCDIKGFAGFAYSFAGKWFGGWSRNKINTDYVARAYRNALKQNVLIKGVKFICKNYQEIKVNSNSFVYCDPPYKGTTGYYGNFNYKEFWKWAIKLGKSGVVVFVSELEAPNEFKCVWKKDKFNFTRTLSGGGWQTEKLFIYNGKRKVFRLRK